ncbi:AAA family ATPase [Candidatus Latescibacterota bacterium]
MTISRLVGSGGDLIAQKVAEDLDYEFVDNTLIVKVAERAGVSVEDAANFDEKYRSKTGEWLKSFMGPRMGKIMIEEGKHLNPKTFVEYCKTVVQGLAERGNVVILGRGGQFILKDCEDAFHVRIVADKKFRVEHLKSSRGITEEDALELIKKTDHMRKVYIERYLKVNWEDPLAYNLILNTSKLGIDNVISITIDAVQKFSKTYEYIPGVKDRRKSEIRRQKKRRKGDRRYSEVGWTKKDIGPTIMRDGRPVRSHIKPERRKGELRKMLRRASDHNENSDK